MDYKSYKAMCDSTLKQIRESENKREELNNKLQKMYQEKSECEKSIIKTLQSQQKQFMDEKRRRAERNENILRTLERVDYQAQLLASKTERLRGLKRQYERYLLSLWSTRKAIEPAAYSMLQGPNLKTIVNPRRPFTAKYEESSIHQTPYYPAYVTELRPNYLLNSPTHISMSPTSPITAHTYQNNQSFCHEVAPLTSVENSILPGNYHQQSPAFDIESLNLQRYDYTKSSQIPSHISYSQQQQKQQAMNDRKSFHPFSDNGVINISDMNQPTTINSIYNHMDLQQQHSAAPQLPLVEKSSFQSIYNQPQHGSHYPHHNYNDSDRNMRMSKAYHDMPLIMSTVDSTSAASIPITTDFRPQQMKIPQTSSAEHRLNNEMNFNPENSVHISDVDTDDSGSVEGISERKPKATAKTRRKSFACEKLDVPLQTNAFDDIKFSDASDQQTHEGVLSGGMKASATGSDTAAEESDMKSINKQAAVAVVASPNDNGMNIMHQVWEKVIEAEPTPVSAAEHGSFIIPKIIVETQIDLTEAAQATTIPIKHVEATDKLYIASTMDVDEKQDRDIPEKLLNQKASYEMEKHSSDNRPNESTSSVSYDNSPLTDRKMSIYHPIDTTNNNNNNNNNNNSSTRQQPPQSSVEYELRNFEDIKISSLSNDGNNNSNDDASNTHESDDIIKGNISLSGSNVAATTSINNINDDTKSPSMALNDKIGEIYRKIEKIEGEYYGEKGKIMENFEMRRLSAASLTNDEAKVEKVVHDDETSLKHTEFTRNSNEHDADVMDMKQQDAAEDENLISQTEWKSNQSEYAAEDAIGNQKSSLYESQMEDQSNYNYYHSQQNENHSEANEMNYQQQSSDYSENPQYTQMYEQQNQQSMFENQEYVVPTASFENGSGNENNNNINSTGDYQTSSVEQYSYEPSAYLHNDTEFQQPQMQYQYDQQQQEQINENNSYEYQTENDASNFNVYNQHQLDANYEQSNYVETSPVDDQNSSNYANDPVYYDYVGAQNQNDGFVTDVHPQAMYDNQNYESQQQGMMGDEVGYGNDIQQNEYISYQHDDNNIEQGNMYQDHSNENNYDGKDSHREMIDTETSNELLHSTYVDTATNEYQTDGSYVNTMQMPLENANYETTQHLVQESSNENIESYHDEGMTETSQSDVSSSQQAHEIDGMIGDGGSDATTKRDDIKLVKQLLDSESSDEPNSSARSNLLKTAIKEEVDESDFDFSAN